MGKLYLHIGTHKTATSAIQQCVYSYTKEFQKNNLNILKHSDLPSRIEFRKSEEITNSLIDDYKSYFKNFLKHKNKNYFLCWEGFSGNPETLYENNSVVLNMLYEALPKDFDLELIVVFRRQDEFVQSIFTQLTQEGKKIKLSDLFKIQYHEGLDWLQFVNNIEQSFGDNTTLHVLPYEPAILDKKNILQLVGEKLNSIFMKNISILPHRNVGFSENAANLCNQMTKSLDSEYQSKILRRSLQKVDNKGVGEEYQYLSNNEKVYFLEYYKTSNAKLAQRYWQKEFKLTNFAPPKVWQVDQKKSTRELVIKDLLGQLEESKKKLNSNIFFRIANKLSR